MEVWNQSRPNRGYPWKLRRLYFDSRGSLYTIRLVSASFDSEITRYMETLVRTLVEAPWDLSKQETDTSLGTSLSNTLYFCGVTFDG